MFPQPNRHTNPGRALIPSGQGGYTAIGHMPQAFPRRSFPKSPDPGRSTRIQAMKDVDIGFSNYCADRSRAARSPYGQAHECRWGCRAAGCREGSESSVRQSATEANGPGHFEGRPASLRQIAPDQAGATGPQGHESEKQLTRARPSPLRTSRSHSSDVRTPGAVVSRTRAGGHFRRLSKTHSGRSRSSRLRRLRLRR